MVYCKALGRFDTGEPCVGCETPLQCTMAVMKSRQAKPPASPFIIQLPGLPEDAKERKTYPIATGVIDYFPDALAAVAHLSFVGNEQHNPGTKLHWDRSKSGDESDALMRHFVQRGTLDKDGIRHSAKVAWRALALLQKEIEDAKP